MNCVIYTRFSPRRNADESESCETQHAYCEQLAHKKGYKILASYADKAVSGAEEDRPQMWEAIERAKGGVLMVYKPDRLARNVYLMEMIRRAVREVGGRIEAVQGDVDGEGIEQDMIRQVLSTFSEYERKIIAKRTSHAMRQHQRNGRRMGRFCPYGWEQDPNDPRRMLPVPAEVAAVDRVNELRTQGKRLADIVRVLNEEMPDVCRKGKWCSKTVYKIAKRAA